MRKSAGAKTYNKVHKKLSEEAVNTHKQELIQAIINMLKEDEGNYQDSIYGLVEEALETRTIPQLRTWLE